MECGKRVAPRQKPFDEVFFDGTILGGAVFAFAAVLAGAWQQPWNLVLCWVGGVGITLLSEWWKK